MTHSEPPPPVPQPAKRKIKKWPWITGVAVVVIIAAATQTSKKKEQETPAAQLVAPKSTSMAASTPATTFSTPTTTTPPPPPAPPPQPEVFQGKGDNVVTLKRPTEPGIVTFECPKCTGNVIVESDGRETLLVNTIGAYTGKRLINIADGSMTNTISVKAKGSWKLTVSGLATIDRADRSASGKGDSVVWLTGSASTATITYKGKSNFVVTYVDITAGRTGLAVNEIGSYQGTVRLPGPSIVQVESEGTWTINTN